MQHLTNLLLAIIATELAALLYFTIRPRPDMSFEHEVFAHANYSVWKFEDGTWRMIQDRTRPGFMPGDPPPRPGNFPNEIIKKPGVRHR